MGLRPASPQTDASSDRPCPCPLFTQSPLTKTPRAQRRPPPWFPGGQQPRLGHLWLTRPPPRGASAPPPAPLVSAALGLCTNRPPSPPTLWPLGFVRLRVSRGGQILSLLLKRREGPPASLLPPPPWFLSFSLTPPPLSIPRSSRTSHLHHLRPDGPHR